MTASSVILLFFAPTTFGLPWLAAAEPHTLPLRHVAVCLVSSSRSDTSHKGLTATLVWTSQVALVVKNPHTTAGDAGDAGDVGLIPGSGRSPGEGNGSPLQSSCLENPMDRGAWWAAVPVVEKSQILLSD